MKKVFLMLGTTFIIGGIIFLLVHSFIVTGTEGESFARDLFGFPIPHPPLWTSYIPYLGFFLDFIFQFFSLHGLAGMLIFSMLLGIGYILLRFGNKKTIDSDKKL